MPGGSEALVVYGINQYPEKFWMVVLVATVGNTAGAMVTFWIGRIFPNKVKTENLRWFRKWGIFTLLFSWLPVVGDGFCLAAGWLRVSATKSLILIAIGKFARYFVLAGVFFSLLGP